MAGQTKMIIITSDEDVIRQFSLNKTTKTQIINMHTGKQVISVEKDKSNIMNSNFLAELSQLNSNHDQLYKRVLDSSDHNQSKANKIPKKSIDAICLICGDRAIGFNFNVLSCSACKAFFRRNANQNLEKLKCLTGQGQCSVAQETRRKCPKCRLDRCFTMGMRKDFILSEEDKQRRRKRLEENRAITLQRLSTSELTDPLSASNHLSTIESLPSALDEIDGLLMDLAQVDNNTLHGNTDLNQIDDLFLETLSVEDWIVIQNIQSSFLSAFLIAPERCMDSIDLSNLDSVLISWSEYGTRTALRYINFLRQIEEFEGLNNDDRFILIKYNLLSVFPISTCLYHKQTDDCCTNDGSEEAEKHRRLFMLCAGSNNISDTSIKLVISLVQVTEQDPTLLSLLLTILIFSPYLSMNENEPPLKDSLAVHRAQSHYINLLWNYLVNKWGEVQACKHLTQLLAVILRIQSAAKSFREFVRDQLGTSNTVDKIPPLMQRVLHIS